MNWFDSWAMTLTVLIPAVGAVVLLLTVGTILSLTEGDLSGESGELALLCGSPTLILGAVFLWLGSRRLKR